MSIDLLRQQPRWKEALVSLREMMASLVQQVQYTILSFCVLVRVIQMQMSWYNVDLPTSQELQKLRSD